MRLMLGVLPSIPVVVALLERVVIVPMLTRLRTSLSEPVLVAAQSQDVHVMVVGQRLVPVLGSEALTTHPWNVLRMRVAC